MSNNLNNMLGEPRDFNIPKTDPIIKPTFEVKNSEMMRSFLSVVKPNAKDGMRSLDLGCGRGWIETMMLSWVKDAELVCVDNDNEQLDKVRKIKNVYDNESERLFFQKPGNQLNIVHQDINEFIERSELADLDLIIINAVLHEISNPEQQKQYLIQLLAKLKKMTKPGGKILLGDFQFAEDVSPEEIKAYQEFQMRTWGHSDSEQSYVNPALLQLILQDSEATDGLQGLKLTFSTSMRATEEINRRYYIMEITNEVA